ncbi:acyl-CoA thioester hydrolase [Virgibacillus subterraneus]|uniref:Acyl-CoA thioester hydrolase n=2 Tax=Virgibacillus TaxID=84406 RepID=A0A1H1B1P1_9BACI|nr:MULTISPECIES: thioesterase family protein [Virgibacillus]SDQ45376.1 acyl-CoA thioester hydrolase [Virgibacillus salinus]SEQ13348.1 acyl-CoA thioester hydrolase [Virgibacillus subterraneus]
MKTVSYIDDLTRWQSEFSFYIPIKIRFSETDMFGHVNNVSAFIYFEEARIEFLKSVGLFQNEGSDDEGVPIVADLQCDYHTQMYFNEKLWQYVKVNHIGNTSLDIHYMALNDKGEMCLTGRGRLVYINPESGKPISIANSMKEKLLTKTDFQ